jgi:coenzyme PQQ synthesis protein D (PqqD)
MKPVARRDRLVVQEISGELVVYDQKRHRAHHLNRTAALIWQSCNGHTTVAQLTKLLAEEAEAAVDEKLVWEALDRLGRAHLLQERVPRPADAAKMSRRRALGTIGRAAGIAILVPAVTSIVAPLPLRASGICDENPCRDNCQDICTNNTQCPPGQRCRLIRCLYPGCSPCLQRRCVKPSTPRQLIIDG